MKGSSFQETKNNNKAMNIRSRLYICLFIVYILIFPYVFSFYTFLRDEKLNQVQQHQDH